MKRLICLLSAMLLCVVMAIGLTGCFGSNLKGEWEHSKTENGVKTTTVYHFLDSENYIVTTVTKDANGSISRSASKGTYEILDYTNHGPQLIVFSSMDGNVRSTYQFFKYDSSEFALGRSFSDGSGYTYKEVTYSKRQKNKHVARLVN